MLKNKDVCAKLEKQKQEYLSGMKEGLTNLTAAAVSLGTLSIPMPFVQGLGTTTFAGLGALGLTQLATNGGLMMTNKAAQKIFKCDNKAVWGSYEYERLGKDLDDAFGGLSDKEIKK